MLSTCLRACPGLPCLVNAVSQDAYAYDVNDGAFAWFVIIASWGLTTLSSFFYNLDKPEGLFMTAVLHLS